MELRCERDVLVEALTTAGRAATTGSGSLPVLRGVRAELKGDRLSLTGTDLDLTISGAVTVAGLEDGVVVVPARLTADIVRSLEPGAVHVVTTAEEARIASGRSQFAVRLFPVDDFPRPPVAPAEEVTLDAAALAEALRQVVRAASHDLAHRPVLTGVLMAAEGDGLRLVATDSYRLALRDLRGASVLSEGQAVLVPSRALGELNRLLTGADAVTLRLGERDATFEVGDVRLSTRLIEGAFPNYQQLISGTQGHPLTIGREPLLDAIRRVRLLADRDTPVRLSLRSDGVELSVVTQDVGQAQEDLDAKYEGDDLVIAFNPEYLADGIEALAGDEVSFEIIDALKRVVLRAPESQDYLYLLMPVRVS